MARHTESVQALLEICSPASFGTLGRIMLSLMRQIVGERPDRGGSRDPVW
jgi:hypothetical protein